MKKTVGMIFVFLFLSTALAGEESIVIWGDYPVVEELGKGSFEPAIRSEAAPLIPYGNGNEYRGKALQEALHLLSANVYGYTFLYKPGSTLMKTEETFEVEIRGKIGPDNVTIIGEGVEDNIYRVKIQFGITPSVRRWQTAFHTNTLRLLESEGTSDFYSGWEGRSDALYETLRNLVLIAAKLRLSSRPLLLKGDILLKGNPEFSVGAGRHYCRLSGYVNFVEILTYH